MLDTSCGLLKYVFCQCPAGYWIPCPDIVEKCSQDRQAPAVSFDRGILVRCAVKAAHRRRIDRSDACEKIRIHILGQVLQMRWNCLSSTTSGVPHSRNKICEKFVHTGNWYKSDKGLSERPHPNRSMVYTV